MMWVKSLRAGGFGVLSLLASAASSQSTDTPKLLANESVVRVEAEARIERMPDAATVGIAIQSEGRTPSDAVQSNTAKLAALMADLRSLGVNEASISADELAARPIYAEVNGEEDPSRVIAYRARQSVGIDISDLSKLQPIVGRLVQDGYGDLHARFRLRDTKPAEAEAQRAAVASAREQAKNLASALGKRVNRLLLVGNSAEAYRGWMNTSRDIIVTGSRITPLVLKPAPIHLESKIYADWSLVDAQ